MSHQKQVGDKNKQSTRLTLNAFKKHATSPGVRETLKDCTNTDIPKKTKSTSNRPFANYSLPKALQRKQVFTKHKFPRNKYAKPESSLHSSKKSKSILSKIDTCQQYDLLNCVASGNIRCKTIPATIKCNNEATDIDSPCSSKMEICQSANSSFQKQGNSPSCEEILNSASVYLMEGLDMNWSSLPEYRNIDDRKKRLQSLINKQRFNSEINEKIFHKSSTPKYTYSYEKQNTGTSNCTQQHEKQVYRNSNKLSYFREFNSFPDCFIVDDRKHKSGLKENFPKQCNIEYTGHNPHNYSDICVKENDQNSGSRRILGFTKETHNTIGLNLTEDSALFEDTIYNKTFRRIQAYSKEDETKNLGTSKLDIRTLFDGRPLCTSEGIKPTSCFTKGGADLSVDSNAEFVKWLNAHNSKSPSMKPAKCQFDFNTLDSKFHKSKTVFLEEKNVFDFSLHSSIKDSYFPGKPNYHHLCPPSPSTTSDDVLLSPHLV